MKQPEQWRKLTKADLKNVDKDAVTMILKCMQVEGCLGRKTSKGHPIIKFNNVVVTTIAGTASDVRSIKNARAKLKRAGLL